MPDHELFSAVLAPHVKAGRVDYVALRNDARLPRHLAQMAATEPAKLPEGAAQFAFWLNAYNAFTLKLAAKYAPDDIRRAIEAEPEKWTVNYLAYGRSLNAAKP